MMRLFSKGNIKREKSSEEEDPFIELAKELDANTSIRDIISTFSDNSIHAKVVSLEKLVSNHKEKVNWDFLQKTFSNKTTPLHLYCLFGFSSLVKSILKSISQSPPFPWKTIFTKDSRGMTALHCAAFMVHDNSLVSSGKKDRKTKEKNTLLVWEKKEKIVEFIVTNKDIGLDIYSRDETGNTFLHYFVSNGIRVTNFSSKTSFSSHFSTALKSSLNEKSTNVQNSEGNTILHCILQERSTEGLCLKICLLSLQAKANPNLQNTERDTCLILAMRKGYGKIVSALLDYWADYTIVGKNNFTALQMTKVASIPEIAKIVTGTVIKETQKPFAVLPRPILIRIFSFLSALDLARLSQVCKYSCRISNDESLWRELADRTDTNDNCWKTYFRITKVPNPKGITSKLSLNQEAFAKLLKKYQGNYPLPSPTLDRPIPEHRPPSRRGSLSKSQEFIGALDELPEGEKRVSAIIPIVPSDFPVLRTSMPPLKGLRRVDSSPPLPRRLNNTMVPIKSASHDFGVEQQLLSPLLSKINDPSLSPPSPAYQGLSGSRRPVTLQMIRSKSQNNLNNFYTKLEVSASDRYIANLPKVIKVQTRIRVWLARKELANRKQMWKQRTNVAHELESTEKTYVQKLTVLINVFLNPLRKLAENEANAIATKEQIRLMFGVLEDIVKINKELLAAMEDRLRSWNYATKLGDIFIERIQYFKLYQAYVSQFTNSLEALHQLINEKPEFAAFIKQAENKAECELQDIESFLILPVQRIPRYNLLLTQLVKSTWKSHKDYENLVSAAKSMQTMASTINEFKRDVEHKEKVIKVQELLIGSKVELIQPSRIWVKEGEVQIFNAQKQTSVPCYLFLFNDMLIFTEYLPKVQKYKFIKYKQLSDLTVKNSIEVNDPQKFYEFQVPNEEFMIIHVFSLFLAIAFELTYEGGFGSHHTRVVYCQSMADKKLWLDALSLWISREKNIQSKRSPKVTEDRSKKRLTRIFSKASGIAELTDDLAQISAPFNFEHKLHIDKDLIWSGEDPMESFDLVEKLGEGAYGSVYKAVHKPTLQQFAAKILNLKHPENDAESIENEINILKKCSNANVVSYYGCCATKDNHIWILMDYCELGSVRNVIETLQTTLTEDQIAVVCQHTLKGLVYLHKQGILHRDIKTANLLINEQGNVCIADFGISRVESEINEVVGTTLYMAPEVIKRQPYDAKSDIWSFGICIIEMAEGMPPYSKLNPSRAMRVIPVRPPPSLSTPKKWSNEFQDFVTQCLQKELEKRASGIDLLAHPFIQKAFKNPKALKTLIEEYGEIRKKNKLMNSGRSSPDAVVQEKIANDNNNNAPEEQRYDMAGTMVAEMKQPDEQEESPNEEENLNTAVIKDDVEEKKPKKKKKKHHDVFTKDEKEQLLDQVKQLRTMVETLNQSVNTLREEMQTELKHQKEALTQEFKHELAAAELRIVGMVQQQLSQASFTSPRRSYRQTPLSPSASTEDLRHLAKARKSPTTSAEELPSAAMSIDSSTTNKRVSIHLLQKVEMFEKLKQEQNNNK